jgi:hypothetical protein
LLLALVSSVVLGFESHRNSWAYFAFQDFYVFSNGDSSATREGVWLLLVSPFGRWVFNCSHREFTVVRPHWSLQRTHHSCFFVA